MAQETKPEKNVKRNLGKTLSVGICLLFLIPWPCLAAGLLKPVDGGPVKACDLARFFWTKEFHKRTPYEKDEHYSNYASILEILWKVDQIRYCYGRVSFLGGWIHKNCNCSIARNINYYSLFHL